MFGLGKKPKVDTTTEIIDKDTVPEVEQVEEKVVEPKANKTTTKPTKPKPTEVKPKRKRGPQRQYPEGTIFRSPPIKREHINNSLYVLKEAMSIDEQSCKEAYDVLREEYVKTGKCSKEKYGFKQTAISKKKVKYGLSLIGNSEHAVAGHLLYMAKSTIEAEIERTKSKPVNA